MRYVIIGNGIAGVCAAERIRGLDRQGTIAMISDEVFIPYSRPMISMVLEGSVPFDRLAIRPANFYERLAIEPVLGYRVARLDTTAKTVFVENGATIPYDKLLIATGADARRLTVPGIDLGNIFYMRTRQDVQAKLSTISRARKVLVLGGGLVGFKAAYGLIRRGLDVTMLISSGYPLSMQLDETAGKMVLDELLDDNLKVRVGVSVTAFEGNGVVSGAQLSDGSTMACDMVVVGKGVLPSLSFVPRHQLDVDLGLLVDETLTTSDSDVFAAGDAAECIDIARKTRWVNAIWPEAAAQGRLAGANMAGCHAAYPGSLSRNVLRVLDLDVMSIGHVNPPDNGEYDIVTAGGPGKGYYRKLVFHLDCLEGAILINGIEQGGLYLALVRQQHPLKIDKSLLLSAKFNFGQLLGQPPVIRPNPNKEAP